jgi:L-serine dehydratase
MHRIVAAPTAGACGVMPAVLLPYAAAHDTPREELIAALYVAAGFGMVIASRASMSGAEAGCQAEIGTASAMAAAALVYLHGGNVQQMSSAVAIALKNMMGLACDPVAGLVEVPCVKRNAAGAMNALCAAELALAGIRSRIPADEVIDAMRAVGDLMSPLLKETGRGGVAASPTAVRFRNDFFGKTQE